MPPTLILVRHAQALHNLTCALQDYSIADPALSELGRDQCRDLHQSLKTKLPADLNVNLIVVSPMRRTIETALRALDFLIEKGVPIQAHAAWQENSDQPCDTGSSISSLKEEFPGVDFSQVDPVYPDKTSPAGALYHYGREPIIARAQVALADLYQRPEKTILVVSHSGFLRAGVTGSWFFNADYRIFDFEDKMNNAPYQLRQWDMTAKGGLGWSWEEKVPLGDGLP